MTRDDIIRLAQEAGFENNRLGWTYTEGYLAEHLGRFAALVAAPLEEEIERLRFCIPEGDAAAAMEYLAYCVEKAVAAEREQCALIAESYEPRCDTCPSGVANAIRARGNTGIKWEIEP
jgi:hypothetical protein